MRPAARGPARAADPALARGARAAGCAKVLDVGGADVADGAPSGLDLDRRAPRQNAVAERTGLGEAGGRVLGRRRGTT